MKVRLKLVPGQRGTKKLVDQYGDRLVCVRYRYDEKTSKRYTTVELIVAESAWKPAGIPPDTIVLVKIGFEEKALREKALKAGGKWSNSRKLWKMPFKTVCDLGLEDKIVVDDAGRDSG